MLVWVCEWNPKPARADTEMWQFLSSSPTKECVCARARSRSIHLKYWGALVCACVRVCVCACGIHLEQGRVLVLLYPSSKAAHPPPSMDSLLELTAEVKPLETGVRFTLLSNSNHQWTGNKLKLPACGDKYSFKLPLVTQTQPLRSAERSLKPVTRWFYGCDLSNTYTQSEYNETSPPQQHVQTD